MTLDEPGLIKMLESYDQESKALKAEALRFCWAMRGGLNYSEAMELSKEEREIISELIKENFEITKKSGMPYF